MTKTHTIARYEYYGIDDCRACCQLEIWQEPDHAPVVLATERLDNHGTSITNRAELLATQVCMQFELDFGSLIWLECYEREDDGNDYHDLSAHTRRSEFDRVAFGEAGKFGLADPHWKPFGLDAAQQLVGEAL